MTSLTELARENGFSHIATVSANCLTPLESVRDMCRANLCGRYNASWSCPPACGSIGDAQTKMRLFDTCLAVQSVMPLEDEFDYPGMSNAAVIHKKRFLNLARQMRLLTPRCLPLTAGSCTLCRTCTYPDRPCRHPQKMFCSMEAMGLLVSDVCKAAGLEYNHGARTITYTSCVLYLNGDYDK